MKRGIAHPQLATRRFTSTRLRSFLEFFFACAFQNSPSLDAGYPVKPMKRILLVFLVLILTVLACSQPTPNMTPPSVETEWVDFSVGEFSMDLPTTWQEETSTDEQVIYTVSDGTASLWIKSWPLIPSLVANHVHEWAEESETATLLSESGAAEKIHLELAHTENENLLRLNTLLTYCDAQAYEVTGVVLEKDFSQYTAIFEQVQTSASCEPSKRYPPLDRGALGMIIIPPTVKGENFDPTAYQESLALARKSGVQVSHYYFHWMDIEKEPGVYDWTIPDYIVEANTLEGFQLSIVFSIIHTTVRGRIPEDLIGLPFDDPIFVQRLSKFLSTFAERYAERVHYLAIGNEVNDYFANHRDEIHAYAAAFRSIREAIHAVNPDLPVGIVFAYHDAETLNTTDVIQQLNRGDYIAYTIYLYNQGFHFGRDPAEIGDYLDRMLALAGDIPVVITETGWSTALELNGSEAGQAEYVRQLFAALSERRKKIRFVSWFALHDPPRDSCKSDALTFSEPGTEPDLNSDSMQAFVTFICNFGLRHADGMPKLAWGVWVQKAREYYK